MKKLTVKKGGQCMACLACVNACSTAFYKQFHQDLSCIRIVDKNGEAKPMTCIQCGKCAKNCEAGAITQNPKTGVYMINKKLCTSCGKCAEVCPMKVIVVPVPQQSALPVASVPKHVPWRFWRLWRSNKLHKSSNRMVAAFCCLKHNFQMVAIAYPPEM